MKILKTILTGLIVLVVLLALVSFLLPSPAPIVRSVTIDAPVQTVYEQVNNLKAWEKWSPWGLSDPTNKVTYGDKTEGEGASYTWEGEMTGTGNLAITNSTAGKSINTHTDFGPMGQMNGTWAFTEKDGSTNINWSEQVSPSNGLISGIIGRYFLAFSDMENTAGIDFEKGLANIKELCESMKSKVETVEVLGTKYYTIRDKVNMADIAKFYTENYPKILAKMQQDKVEMTGMPRGLYYEWDMENHATDMAAAVPVSPIPEADKEKKTVDIGVGKAKVYDNYMVYDYYGGYHGMTPAHEGLGKVCGEEFKGEAGLVMEEYVTDPGAEPDSSKWLTRIYYVAK